jgi:hypothetical protein
MEELKQWVTAFHKGGIQMSEDYAGLFRPPSAGKSVVQGGASMVLGGGGGKSVATAYSIN